MSHVMKERYQQEIVPALMKALNLENVMEVPRIEKVVVNIGVGEALDNSKALDAAVGDLTQITGQKPVITKARKSIANFKLREGRAIGVKVTLRGERMWSFLDRLMNIALPRVRDFRGVLPILLMVVEIILWVYGNNWFFLKLSMTRLISCAGWKFRSSPPPAMTRRPAAVNHARHAVQEGRLIDGKNKYCDS